MAPMIPIPQLTLARRDFLRTLAATASSLAGGAALAACGAPASNPRSVAGRTAPPSRATEPVPTRPVASGGVVRVGLLAPTGDRLADGVQLYLEQVGSQARGHSLKVVLADAAADPLTAARHLIEIEGAAVLVSGFGGDHLAALSELADASRTVLLVAAISASPAAREWRSPYVFRTAGTVWQMAYPLGDWVARNLARRVYLSAAEGPEGREAVAAFRDAFTVQGGAVAGEAYLPPDQPDYADHLRQIARVRPEATFAFYRGTAAVRFVQQYAAAGLPRDTRLTGAGRLVDESLLAAEGRAARGAISSLYWAPGLERPENQRFLRAYRDRFGEDADAAALAGYDAARVVVEALRRSGSATADPAKLAAAVAGVEFASPRGPFRFDLATQAVVHDVYIREVKDERGTLRNVVLDRFAGVADTAERAT